MRSSASDVRLGNGSHTELIKCASEESGKCGNEWNGSVAAASTNSNTDKILLCNEALDVAILRDL